MSGPAARNLWAGFPASSARAPAGSNLFPGQKRCRRGTEFLQISLNRPPGRALADGDLFDLIAEADAQNFSRKMFPPDHALFEHFTPLFHDRHAAFIFARVDRQYHLMFTVLKPTSSGPIV